MKQTFTNKNYLNMILIAFVMFTSLLSSITSLKVRVSEIDHKSGVEFTEDKKKKTRKITKNPKNVKGWKVGTEVPYNLKGGKCDIDFQCEYISKGCKKNTCQ